MSLELQLELWDILQEHIVDVKDAAEDFVALLIENGVSPDDIASSTSSDDIKNALSYHNIEMDMYDEDNNEEFEDD